MPDLPRGVYQAPFALERPSGASQTLLSHIDHCPYSGALYLRHKGGARGPALARGEAWHEFAERFIRLIVDSEETSAPPDIAKDLMQAVIEERTDLAVPTSEQDACRLMAWNFASALVIDPQTVREGGIEVPLELVIGNWVIRGRIDLLLRGDGWLTIRDWKTSLAVQSVDDYVNSFQGLTYGLLGLEGVPEDGGKPFGRGLDHVRTEEVYPRYLYDDGMLTRYAEFDRARLADHKRTLEALLAKLDHGLEAGEWAAAESSHCNICPAAAECPIPREHRTIRTIGTPDDALEVASHVRTLEADLKDEKAALRAWVGENGDLEQGDEVWGFKLERRESANKDAIKELLRECGQDEADFFKQSTSTRFGKRKAAA